MNSLQPLRSTKHMSLSDVSRWKKRSPLKKTNSRKRLSDSLSKIDSSRESNALLPLLAIALRLSTRETCLKLPLPKKCLWLPRITIRSSRTLNSKLPIDHF